MSKDETRSYLLRDVPVEEFDRFKRACGIEGVNIRQKLIAFIRQYGSQYGDLIKKIDKMKEGEID